MIGLVSFLLFAVLFMVASDIGVALTLGGCSISFLCALSHKRFSRLKSELYKNLMSFLGVATVCFTRLDAYAVMLLALLVWIFYYYSFGLTKRAKLVWFSDLLVIAFLSFFFQRLCSSTTDPFNLVAWYYLLVYRSPSLFPALQYLLSLIIFCLYAGLFSASQSSLRAFIRGLKFGLYVSSGLIILQLGGFALPYLGVEGAFWLFVKRQSGTFQDPNAFGISGALILFICLYYRWFFLSVLWLILGFYSGSRLYTCGLVFCLLAGIVLLWHQSLYKWTRKNARKAIVTVILTIILSSVIVILSSYFTQYNPGLRRSLSPFDISRIYETFYTRSTFWFLGWKVFKDNILTGVGFGNFENIMTSYATRNGNNLNLWIDNPNSLYLGLSVEMGLIGLICFIVGCSALSFKRLMEPRSIFLFASGLFLLVALQFGPHVYFIECSLLGALILGSCLRYKVFCTHDVGLIKLVRRLVFLGIIWISTYSSEFGFYHWERDNDGYVRWTMPRAQGLFSCRDDYVTLALAKPNVSNRELVVSSPHEEFVIRSEPAKWVDLNFNCQGATRMPIRIKTSRGWIPGVDNPSSQDWRNLGALIKTDPSRMMAPP
jgi:O-antigen ligase